MKRIVTSLSPNAEADDVWLAVKTLLRPWRWQTGSAIADLETSIGGFFRAQATTFESGRSALSAGIRALDIPQGSEIILQAFTCVAVPNSIRWAGCIPIYADVDPQTYTMDTSSIESRITPKTRAILVQHTFGIPANIDAIMDIARRHTLLIIEDCAHSFGSRWKGQLLGTFGDVAIFSFGRDKALSSVFGGIAMSRREDVGKRLREIQTQAPIPSRTWIIKQLLHPVILNLSLKTYDIFSLGKVILEAAKRLHFISKAFEPAERYGGRPSWAHQRMPNALAALALHQWKKRERFEAHRRKITEVYQKGLATVKVIHPHLLPYADATLLRYPLRTKFREVILKAGKLAHIELGDWYAAPIAPPSVDEKMAGLDRSTTPHATQLAQEMVNLPTHIHISEKDAKRIVDVIRSTVTSL